MKHLFTIRLLVIALAILLTAQISHAQIKWDFDQGTGTASPIAASIPPNVTVSDFSFGNTFGTVTPMVTNTSASNYTGASANYNATVSANALSPFSIANNTYFTFTLTPATGYNINLSAIQFGARSIGAGPNAYQIYTSADNYTTAIAGNSLTNNSAWVLKQPTITAVSGAVSTPLTIRVYGYSGVSPVSGTANWRIDDVAVTVSVVMPISLKSFSIAVDNKQPVLNWQTAQEINANYFSIEKSSNAKDFTEVTKIIASNKAQGSTYQYTDIEKLTATKYFRIKMVDKDGSYKYSNVLSVTDKENIAISAYPNPTTTNNISLSHPKAQEGALIKIVGINGAVIMLQQVSKDAVQSTLNLQGIAKGKYVIVFENGSNKNAIQFDKQ